MTLLASAEKTVIYYIALVFKWIWKGVKYVFKILFNVFSTLPFFAQSLIIILITAVVVFGLMRAVKK